MPLSQIIVTSRYLKSGSARSVTKRKNYTKYIATRETVEKHEQNQYAPNAATTEKQSEFDSVHIISYSLQNSKWFKRMSTAKYNADTYQPLITTNYHP